MLDCLKFYSKNHFPLFPCQNQGQKAKAPLTTHGFKDATTDWQQIEKWYKQFPGCAWGVATSADRCVLDVDVNKGGAESLANLIAEHGELPKTPKVVTGSGGYHYWFRSPSGTGCGKPYPGIDRKAEGGYVIVPPSRILIPEHKDAYKWEVKPWDLPFAAAPTWLLVAKAATTSVQVAAELDPWVVQPAGDDLVSHPGSPEGERQQTLCQLVGTHLARGDSLKTIMTAAETWAERCDPPFEVEEWRKHVEGLWQKDQAKSKKPDNFYSGYLFSEAGKEGKNSSAQAQGEFFPSFPAKEIINSAQADGGNKLFLSQAESEHPSLSAEAYYGLFGEMLTAIAAETEADPAGILLGWLTCFGNVAGRGVWVTVGARVHHPALYIGIVGRTSDAKGDGWAVSAYPFRQLEPAWAVACIHHGVGSGEGLIERIADDQQTLNNKGEVVVIPGSPDKRCLLRLSELSQCFKRGRRENATLSEHLREAWDGEPIHIPNRKANALASSDYAVSVVGDVTPGIIRRLLEGGSEGFDGFANRFLWCAVRRSRFLPSGGSMKPLAPYLGRLAAAIAFASGAGELSRDAEADRLWCEVYPSLCISADFVPHTDRARPYVVRLSMLYALADCSIVIRVEHLRAALAVWDYCRQSAQLIFGQGQGQEDPLWLRLLNAIVQAPGISRSELLRAFRSVSALSLDGVLAQLEVQGLAHRRMVAGDGSGRRAECWYPGGNEPEPEPEPDNYKKSSPTSVGKEGKNSSPESQGANSFLPQGREGKNSSPESQGKEGKNSDSEQKVNSFLPQGREGKNSGSEGSERTNSFLPILSAWEGKNSDSEQKVNSFLPSHCEAESQGSEQKVNSFLPSQAAAPKDKPNLKLSGSTFGEAEAELGRQLYPTAEAWAAALEKAKGRVTLDDADDCILILPQILASDLARQLPPGAAPSITPDLARRLRAGAAAWLPHVCGEYRDFVEEIRNMA